MGMGGKNVAKWMMEKEIKARREEQAQLCVRKGSKERQRV
jgi:hypothetical protein